MSVYSWQKDPIKVAIEYGRLQVVIALLGVSVLTALLWEPQLEGRNVNATQFEIYFKDPFLVDIYLAFIPFFVGLFQLFKL